MEKGYKMKTEKKDSHPDEIAAASHGAGADTKTLMKKRDNYLKTSCLSALVAKKWKRDIK